MSLIEKWEGWSKQFALRPLRERQIIGAGACASIFLLMFSLVVDPIEAQKRQLNQILAGQREGSGKLASEVAQLRTQQRDPDAPNRAMLAQTKDKIAQVELDLKKYDGLVVSPGKMPLVLKNLLAKHPGLEVVSFKTVPVMPLVGLGTVVTSGDAAGSVLRKATAAVSGAVSQGQPGGVAQPAPATDNASVMADSLATGGMYRHGVELTVSGSYADLMAYANELQRASPRPLWSGMKLKVVQYPKSELTLMLYTLSLDLPWLAV